MNANTNVSPKDVSHSMVTAKTGSGKFDLPEFSLDCMTQSKIGLTGGENTL